VYTWDAKTCQETLADSLACQRAGLP
jgi:hypothetical protein